MSQEEVSDLIGRVAIGDRVAFRRLYERTSAKLFGVCLRILKNRSDAEDVLQEIYVKIWRDAGKYRITGHSPMTWLITVARNQAIDNIRARDPIPVEIEAAAEIAADAATPEVTTEHRGESRRLVGCLEKLPSDRAEAVKAAYQEGYSYQELAERFGLPLNTVRTWLRRSLISLRECLSS